MGVGTEAVPTPAHFTVDTWKLAPRNGKAGAIPPDLGNQPPCHHGGRSSDRAYREVRASTACQAAL